MKSELNQLQVNPRRVQLVARREMRVKILLAFFLVRRHFKGD